MGKKVLRDVKKQCKENEKIANDILLENKKDLKMEEVELEEQSEIDGRITMNVFKTEETLNEEKYIMKNSNMVSPNDQ